MKTVLLEGRKIEKSFVQGGRENRVLDKVDVDIYEGDFTIVMGASGAGKSTLLYALSGMDALTGGQVFYRGQEISGYGEKQMARLRAEEFGFVFQQTHLVSNLTLFENVAVAGYVNGREKEASVRQRAQELLEKMHVREAADRLPSRVSGGEAQRAAMARAVMNRPGLLFADEPTGALNKANSEEVLKLMTEVNRDGQSILMVTHDLRAAIRGTRLLYLEDGKVLDELELSPYQEDEGREREEKLRMWLTALQW